MKEISKANTCERADDLIGFLYAELSESDAKRFELHLRDCGACEAEFRSFGQIRASIVEWRNESLGLGRSPTVAAEPMLVPAAVQPREPAKPSAIAALREFFALSPLWMKGAAAFAAVLFCVCVVLAVAYLKGGPSAPAVANVNSGKVYTPQEVAAAVEKAQQETRVKEKQPGDHVKVEFPPPKKAVDRSAGSARSGYVVARNPRRPFTPQERQELATDLRLVTSRDDDDLDFTTDSNRPTP